MPVAVKWVQKKRGDNHLPRFRPTDSDYLENLERKLNREFLQGLKEIPGDIWNRIIFGNLHEDQARRLLLERLAPTSERIAKAIFESYIQGTRDGTERLRTAVNDRLRQLGSNARLGMRNELKKETVLAWEPFPWADTKVPPLELWDMQPDSMPGKVYARFRAAEIISSVTADVQASISILIGEGFTEAQTFRTGRTVTGLTPDQTARRLFALLSEVSPVPITGADYASFIVPHTEGLFPRWAVAVKNSMETYSSNLVDQGVPAREVKRRTTEHAKKYGDKLRRARGRMIARTEVAYAQNRGLLDTMMKAQADGLVGPDTLKEWVTGPTDVCEVCTPMGGVRTRLGTSFDWGTGGGDYPPAHPNCRCSIEMVTDIRRAPTLMGTGARDDAFRYAFPNGFLGYPASPGIRFPR